nr:MAG: hypothetical protein B6I27_02610 [Erwiniaceae bacterium 4572_131]
MKKETKNSMQNKFLPEFETFGDLVDYLENEMNIYENLLLDITNLDVDWLAQPSVAFKWNQLFNVAQFLLRQLETELKEQIAEKYLYLKQKAVEEKEKTTEALLNNRVLTDPDIINLQTDLFDGQYVTDILSSAKKAIDDRRRTLEGLTELFVTHYFVSERDNQALKELGGEKEEQQQNQALNKNEKLKTLLKSRRK